MNTKIENLRRPRNLLLLFEILAISLLFLSYQGSLDQQVILMALGLIFTIYISNFALSRITTGDNYIFLIVSMLVTIGIIMVFRIDPDTGIKQLQWSLLGIIFFYITYFVFKNLKSIDRWGSLFLILAVLLLVSTLLFGKEIYGAKNWIAIGSAAFQPSEFVKILLIFIIASFYKNYERYTIYKKPSYIILFITYLLIGLLFIQRDLGTAVIFLGMFMSIQFIYEPDRKAVLLNILLLAVGAVAGYFLFNHVRTRVAIWLDPWSVVYDAGRQIAQSLFAIAEGGFFGAGIGYGYPNLIPVSYSDFIFPVICEEMGAFVGMGIIMLYMILSYRGIKIALAQENLYYRIVAICVSVLFTLQSFLNIGGVTQFIPLTGLTLPFISYGGSSMLSNFIALGLLQVTSETIENESERGDE